MVCCPSVFQKTDSAPRNAFYIRRAFYFSHRGPRGWLLFLPIYLHNKSLLIFLRNGYVLFYYCSNILARVKAVELRQKNRDELLAQIEEYKKELSQVILVYSMNNQFSSVLLKSPVELLPSLLKSRLSARTSPVLLLSLPNKRELP